MPKIIGLSGSLRASITTSSSKTLLDRIKKISDKNTLFDYLSSTTGSIDNNSLGHKKKLVSSLSNSEVALILSLWSAYQKNIDIEYLALNEFFPPSRKILKQEYLLDSLKSADAIIISGPVYFGDRSSIVHQFIDIIKKKHNILQECQGKLYAGISVGAKRNGGQETNLIYQILDMVNIGFLAVGNDTETTAQYGGTCCAGNIGTLINDEYGVNTAMGVGRRVASYLQKKNYPAKLISKVKIIFLILQEKNNIASNYIKQLTAHFIDNIEFSIIDTTKLKLLRCLACDTCPEKIGNDEVYRCKIGKQDDFINIHNQLLDHDVIIPISVSPIDTLDLKSNYQVFIERTRYLRRGDYALSDTLFAPLVIREVGNADEMHIRMITSFIRHNTIVFKPLIETIYNNEFLNQKEIINDFKILLKRARETAIIRLVSWSTKAIDTQYNPVGYVLKSSSQNDLGKRRSAVENRNKRLALHFNERAQTDE